MISSDSDLIDDEVRFKLVDIYCNLSNVERAKAIFSEMSDPFWKGDAEEVVVESAGWVGDWVVVENFLEGEFEDRMKETDDER